MQLDCNILDHEVQILPKVELHAHLSGCFRASVLLRLLNIMNNQSALDQNLFNQYSDILNQVEQNHPNQQLNLIKCFDYFSIVNFIIQNQDALLKTDLASLYNVHNEANMNIFKHQTLSTKSPILYFLIKSVLLDFENDRVIYLELRFSPKSIPAIGVSQRDYVAIVLEAVKDVEERGKMNIRLILSLNREFITNEKSKQAVDNLIELSELSEDHHRYIVGIDLSGNPQKGEINGVLDYLKELRKVQSSKSIALHLTIHTAEVEEAVEETNRIFELCPERLGHICFLSKDQQDRLNHAPNLNHIGIEICPTSNLNTLGIELIDHHFGTFHSTMGHRIAICTDDTGLFNTTLSNELSMIKKIFNLSIEAIRSLQLSALDQAFCDETLKNCLKLKLLEF